MRHLNALVKGFSDDAIHAVAMQDVRRGHHWQLQLDWRRIRRSSFRHGDS